MSEHGRTRPNTAEHGRTRPNMADPISHDPNFLKVSKISSEHFANFAHFSEKFAKFATVPFLRGLIITTPDVCERTDTLRTDGHSANGCD